MVQRQARREMLPGEAPAVERYAWVILLVVFVASVAAPLSMAKVPPLMPILREVFALDLSQGGALMSVFAITGLLLALPTGLVMQRLGLKATGLIALGCLIVGGGAGALAGSAGLLLASRVVEGIGMGLITVAAPAIIAAWFPPHKQGMAMGLWATWVPVGNVLMYNLAPAASAAWGWQAVWWGSAGFAALAFALFAGLMRMPAVTAAAPPAGDGQAGFRRALANRDIWLLALSFGCFNLVFLAIGTFYPTFLNEVHAFPLPQAAFVASISTSMVLVSAPAAGWLSDRIGSRRWLLVAGLAAIAAILLLPFRVSGGQIYALMVVMGLLTGIVPAVTFAAVPEVMTRPQLAGAGMAVVSVGQNAGMVVGPVLFGSLVQTLGWVAAGGWLIPACLLALVAAFAVRVR